MMSGGAIQWAAMRLPALFAGAKFEGGASYQILDKLINVLSYYLIWIIAAVVQEEDICVRHFNQRSSGFHSSLKFCRSLLAILKEYFGNL